jgi:hypothetical protein
MSTHSSSWTDAAYKEVSTFPSQNYSYMEVPIRPKPDLLPYVVGRNQ